MIWSIHSSMFATGDGGRPWRPTAAEMVPIMPSRVQVYSELEPECTPEFPQRAIMAGTIALHAEVTEATSGAHIST